MSSVNAASEAPSYKDTLNLPKTAFDMKANLTTREPAMLKQWQEQDLYGQIRAARKNSSKGKWVLHDGPPYANGDIHMGHLINKVLKDIVVKFRTMQGYDSPFVPGWDCHGLPIESAIQKELGPKFRELSKEDLRKKCHDYAMKYVKLQGDSFQRLGILGEFDNPYLTLNHRYEAAVLDVLAELVQRDLVYRKKKPVHWCINDRTALAEAELEYANRNDHSIYVEFQIADQYIIGGQQTSMKKMIEEAKPELLKSIPALADPYFKDLLDSQRVSQQVQEMLSPFRLMIWTTTPWTLPANRAVAVHPTAIYSSVTYDVDGKKRVLLIAKELVSRVMAADGHSSYEVVDEKTGRELVEGGLSYVHPLDPSRTCPVVLADYVTLEDGTGLVHTAPGHGTEDYQTGLRNNLEIYNPVLPDGRYDDTVPDFLKGKSIWDANQLVIDKLKENGTLFHHQQFDHEYPHCWRCKKPVIFRATEQWFVKAAGEADLQPSEPRALASDRAALDTTRSLPYGRGSERDIGRESQLKHDVSDSSFSSETRPSGSVPAADGHASALWNNAENFVKQVQFVPAWGRNRLEGMLATRPDWCISRQRSWGVPIPAFFDEKGNVFLTEKTVRRVAEYFKDHGADSWYTDSPAKILGLDSDAVARAAELQVLDLPGDLQVETLVKGQDILDVWFESGASHHAVLECTHPELGYPATMYLEGSDQHRGWFQASLLEAAGYKKEPPFKEVLTHGFIVDQNGRKMSKSEGNDIKVETALKEYGADILRLWVSSVDYQNDIPLSKDLLARTADAYRKIRNTIRYLLGNLYDFDPEKHMASGGPRTINTWMFYRADDVFRDCYAAYDSYEFHHVFRKLYEFCNVEISALYAKAIKDRLYCELPDSQKRRAAQSTCYWILIGLVELLAPILVYTAEETWKALRQLPGYGALEPSIHLRTIDFSRAKWENPTAAHWAVLMPLIEKGNKQLEELKKSVGLGNALDAEAVIILPTIQDEISRNIANYGPEIEDALGVGFHRIEHGETWDIKIIDTREKYPSCARSWKRRPDVGSDSRYPDLSKRDAEVVATLRKK